MERRLILDYVASSFILGNDFLPHLPSLKIKEGGLNRVIECYKEVQQEHLGQFLVYNPQDKSKSNNSNYEATHFNTDFLVTLLQKLKAHEENDLIHHEKESQIRQSRFQRNLHYRAEDQYQKDVMIWEYVENQFPDKLKLGHVGWESRYYAYYLGENNPEQVQKVAHNYYEGMIWMLRYYQGNRTHRANQFIHTCPKWDWSYHYRNAPVLKDLIETVHSPLEFSPNIGQPVKYYIQLLCILPPQSNALLPPKIGKLMTHSDSPIIHYYPVDFQIDMQNKRFRWECYPILPQINLSYIRKITSRDNI